MKGQKIVVSIFPLYAQLGWKQPLLKLLDAAPDFFDAVVHRHHPLKETTKGGGTLRDEIVDLILATPPDKYNVLVDAGNWTTNIGYPGYTNAAIAEIFNSGLIGKLMGQAATGKLTPEEALNQADAQVQRIFQKWRERGKV